MCGWVSWSLTFSHRFRSWLDVDPRGVNNRLLYSGDHVHPGLYTSYQVHNPFLFSSVQFQATPPGLSLKSFVSDKPYNGIYSLSLSDTEHILNQKWRSCVLFPDLLVLLFSFLHVRQKPRTFLQVPPPLKNPHITTRQHTVSPRRMPTSTTWATSSLRWSRGLRPPQLNGSVGDASLWCCLATESRDRCLMENPDMMAWDEDKRKCHLTAREAHGKEQPAGITLSLTAQFSWGFHWRTF